MFKRNHMLDFTEDLQGEDCRLGSGQNYVLHWAKGCCPQATSWGRNQSHSMKAKLRQ